MRFIYKKGNLIYEESDFIVNASNTKLLLGSGVSKAFREHCGKQSYQKYLYTLRDTYLQNNQFLQGSVIVSNSGSANNFTYALHCAVMNYTDPDLSREPTYDHIETCLVNILRIVEDISAQSSIVKPKITIPLLGTGTAKLNKNKVLSLIEKVFAQSDMDLTVVVYFYGEVSVL